MQLDPFSWLPDSDPVDFTIPGSTPAALLLHGYLGSPAEMRPLAQALNGRGWTVRGFPWAEGIGPW
jgi:esterase/lipase